MKLVIVESPIKANTIYELLKKLKLTNHIVKGTGGHVQNLPSDRLSVQNAKGKFIGHFEVSKDKKKIVAEIKKLTKEAEEVYVCTDDDREGERIAEDIIEICGIKEYNRIIFREITEDALKKAFLHNKNVTKVNKNIVLAQNTRRLVDRVIGYRLRDPFIYYFKKIKNINLFPRSTGRVEALALHIIAERETAIETYHENGATLSDVVIANYKYNGVPFQAKGRGLVFKQTEREELEQAISKLNSYEHVVSDFKEDITSNPPPKRLISSAVYAKCSYLFNITPSEVMDALKILFYLSLINYPRTDSYEVSDSATDKIIDYLKLTLKEEYQQYILTKKREIRKKNKFSQEAHECIRPIEINKKYSPSGLETLIRDNPKKYSHLKEIHLDIYKYIWNITIASQLVDSVYDTSKVTINAGEYIFEETANFREYLGWECLELDSLKDKNDENEIYNKKQVILPPISIDTKLSADISSFVKHSHAPKRISENMLIKRLDKENIARPSTLPTISKKLLDKKYITSIKNIFSMTELGTEINLLTKTELDWLVNFDNNRDFEEIIIKIEEGSFTDVDKVIAKYWDAIEDFKKKINFTVNDKLKGANCPKCNTQNIVDKIVSYSCASCDFITYKTASFNYLQRVSQEITSEKQSNKIIEKILIDSEYPIGEGKCLSYKYNEKFKNYSFTIKKCRRNKPSVEVNDKDVKTLFKQEVTNIINNRSKPAIANKVALLLIKIEGKEKANIVNDFIMDFTKKFNNKKCYIIDDNNLYFAVYGENIMYAKEVQEALAGKYPNSLKFNALKIKDEEDAESFFERCSI